MLQEDFLKTDWKHHDIVKLTNGKEYVVQKKKKRYIILLSVEYEAYFVADHNIVVDRTYASCYDTYEEALVTDVLQPSHRALIEEYLSKRRPTGEIINFKRRVNMKYLSFIAFSS